MKRSLALESKGSGSHGNDSNLVLRRVRGGKHRHGPYQSLAQPLTARQEPCHTFPPSGLDETMRLKLIDDRSPGVIFVLGHPARLTEREKPVHETLPVNHIPPKVLLEILGLTGRRVHPINTEPTAFRWTGAFQKESRLRIVKHRINGFAWLHKREFRAGVLRPPVRRVQVLDRSNRAPQCEQLDSNRLHLAIVRQRKHVTDSLGFRERVLCIIVEPTEIRTLLLAMCRDANPMGGRPALPIAERDPHVDGQCHERQSGRQQRHPQRTASAHRSLRKEKKHGQRAQRYSRSAS